MGSVVDKVASAYATLARKGLAASATLTRTVPGAYDPATGTNTAGTTTTSACLVSLDGSSLASLGFKFGEGLVQAGDLLASVPAKGLTFQPGPGDKLTIGTAIYTVVQSKPTYAGHLPALWEMAVRR